MMWPGTSSRVLLFLARDADACPRNRVETCVGDRLAAVAANPVRALVDAPQRFFNRLKDFRVGLLQLQLNVDFVVAAGLIGHVALTRVVFYRRLKRLDAAGPENFGSLLQKRVL